MTSRTLVHWFGVIGVIGGWLVTLTSFSDALTPQAIGGLLISLSGAMLTRAPKGVRSLPGGSGGSATVTRIKTKTSEPSPNVEIKEEVKTVTKKEGE